MLLLLKMIMMLQVMLRVQKSPNIGLGGCISRAITNAPHHFLCSLCGEKVPSASTYDVVAKRDT